MMLPMAINRGNVSDVQQQILMLIKQQGESTNAEIADYLNVSYEAVRQQLRQMEAAQLVVARSHHSGGQRTGRPTRYYALSAAAEHLFPKAYDELAVEMIDTVVAALGPDALRQVLASFTDEQVRLWAPRLHNKALTERLEALKDIYLEGDVYMEVSEDQASGDLHLVERNCPFLNVATRRPALCSVTISTLSRLLGHVVTRERRFQDGDGRCVFRVHLDRPVNNEAFRFAFEEELSNSR
jgi:predicted ArsR family transcriptional regulator